MILLDRTGFIFYIYLKNRIAEPLGGRIKIILQFLYVPE